MFQLVDTSKTQQKRYGPARRQWQGGRRQQQLQQARGKSAAQLLQQQQAQQAGGANRNQQAQSKGKKQAAWRNYRRRDQRPRIDRQASVRVQADWNVVEEFDLAQLTKLQANAPSAEDLMWCGSIEQYDDVYDRVTTRTERKLERCENKEFYYVTTTDDPVIEKLAVENAGNVFATDAILAHLMASPRSVYPWDLVVQKLDDTLFFDKRDNSQFDYLTVNETAYEAPAPNQDDPDNINNPDRLALEATMINQNFSQMVLKQGDESQRKEMDHPNPFFDEEDAEENMEPATLAYRYRRFKFGGGSINLIARCEINGSVLKRGKQQYMTTYALNEWDSKLSNSEEWRQKIDTQRGAILATELKNNSCKLAKWTAQSILAGADQMKIGYVSRQSRTNAYDHVILGTQFFKPKEFATQITLQQTNMWGIIKMLVELFQGLDNGKYVIMRDPNKPVVRVYSVPMSTFESDEEDDEEGEDNA